MSNEYRKVLKRIANGEPGPRAIAEEVLENGSGPASGEMASCMQAKSHLVDALEAANPAQAYTLLNQAIQTLDDAIPEGDT